MSNHLTLTLHYPEETVTCDFAAALTQHPTDAASVNPISDYFSTASRLVAKIVDTKYANDSEILGLLVLGVVSSAEFYFRSVLSRLTTVCPICEKQTEALTIPSASTNFYAKTGYAAIMSAFEHESLADSKKIIGEIRRFANLNCADDTSVKKALEDFERLCELRHCFVHTRGFAGLKAVRAISPDGPRRLQKVLVQQQQALDFIKLSHNAVRAVNRYLADETINRWIDRDVLTGQWSKDKALFTRFVRLFAKDGEDSYGGTAQAIYASVKPSILKRQQGIAAKVAGNPS